MAYIRLVEGGTCTDSSGGSSRLQSVGMVSGAPAGGCRFRYVLVCVGETIFCLG